MSKSISITDLYEILSVKIGKDEAGQFISYIEDKISDQQISNIQNQATKTDIKEKIDKAKSELLYWVVTNFIMLIIIVLGLYALIIFRK